MGRGSYRAESWNFSLFVLNIYLFVAFQKPFCLGISSNFGGNTLLFCLQKFSNSILLSATRGHLKRKWMTVSSSSPHSQSGEADFPILWRCCFSWQWPVRTCVTSCWMNLFFRYAAFLWCGKNWRVKEPVVHMLQSFCNNYRKLDLTFALSSVGDQAISVGVLLKFWIASLANCLAVVDPSGSIHADPSDLGHDQVTDFV
jgi:hypothetical protein